MAAPATSKTVVAQIDALLDEHTDAEIARLLNERGLFSGESEGINHHIVARVRREQELRSRYDGLLDASMLTPAKVARRIPIATPTVWAATAAARSCV